MSNWFGIACAAAAIWAAPAFALEAKLPGENAKWRHYRSANFEVYATAPEWVVTGALNNLELLRAFFLETLQVRANRPLPITLFIFGNDAHFQGYVPPSLGKNSPTGIMLSGTARSIIMMRLSEQDERTMQTVRHEFVHHMFRVVNDRPPMWFEEGIASMLSTVKREQDKLVFGRPPVGLLLHAREESMLPLERLLAMNLASQSISTGEHTGIFYAQSWALLHFCYFGESDVPREKRFRFLELARSAEFADSLPVAELVQRELGLTLEELNRQLKRYVRVGGYRPRETAPPVVQDPKEYVARAVSREEIRLRLAELKVRTHEDAAAELVLLDAATRYPDDPRPHEALAGLASRRHDATSMVERWRRALDVPQPNPAVAHAYVEHRMRQLFARFDPYYVMPPELAHELRGHLRRSIAAEPEQSEAYEALAWVEASSREPELPNVAIVQARFSKLRARAKTVVALAAVRHRLGRDEEALRILDELAKLPRTEWSRQAARALRAKISRAVPPALGELDSEGGAR